MTINDIQNSIIDEFGVFDDWMDRYQQLIDMGRELPPIDAKHRTEQYLIQGCQSKVWLDAELTDEGTVRFTADSDAIITKGIISLLIQVYNGRTPAEIAADDFSFVESIGLRENLSPTRANGLNSMIETIRREAEKNV